MAFPNNPVNNQLWSEGGRQYRYSTTLPGWQLSGAAGGDQDMGGNRIVNMVDAVDPNDAVNLSQLEQRAMRAGDLGGTVASTTVIRIQGQNISTTAPTVGQDLRYNATTGWTAATNTVTLTGDVTASGDASPAAGIATVVERIRGSNVSTTTPNNNNQFLRWNQGTLQWQPDFIQSIQNRGVSNAVPQQNDVLAYVGTQWQPIAAGAGLTDAPDALQYTRSATAWNELTDITNMTGVAAGTATQTLPTTTAQTLRGWLASARNVLAWLTARFTAAGEANALNLTTARTITVDPTITTAASFTGAGNVSAGPSLAIAAGAATATLPVVTASSLSTWLTTARNNLLYAVTPNLTAGTAANTLPTAGTATALWTLLNTIRNCLDWCQQRAAAIPTGGTTNQYLAKTSATNYATAWQTVGARASSSTVIGAGAGGNDVGASAGTFIGFNAGAAVTHGNCTIVGASAAPVGSSLGITAFGSQSCLSMTAGNYSTMIGFAAARYYGGSSMAFTGTATNCVYVGYNTRPSAETGNINEIALGYNAVAMGNNTAQIGNNQVLAVYRGNGTSANWNITSDSRVKDRVEPADLDRCLAAVKALPVSRFAWRPEHMKAHDRHVTGWLADDMEKVFPKAVTVLANAHDLHDVKTTDATQLLPTLWGAVQKLIERNDILERELVVLRENYHG